MIRAAAVTPLPKAPSIVMGVLDLQGQVIPVFNVRRRFALPERELLPEDQFVIARAGGRTVALAVDEACDVVAGEERVPAAAIHEEAGYLSGVLRTAAGLVLIHDLDAFLSQDEEAVLEAALRQDTE